MFGYIYDEIMQLHECPYDPEQRTQEKSERAVLIHARLKADGLLNDSVQIPLREAKDWELRLNHPQELIDTLNAMQKVDDLEEFCKSHELLWLCNNSYKIARLVVGGVIDFLIANAKHRIGNGFAIVRPPGHHSYGNSPQGFCLFNNVAIAAKYAVEKLGFERILIVDVDYHCGNGLYHSLKGDKHFVYINFHSYHYGAFWPYEEEYDYDNKYENIISIPLNCELNSESDYMAAMHHLVMPIAHEFNPQLVLVSLGFDSAYYDDLLDHGQGVKAHGYGHIIKLLDSNWPDKVLAVLEGGYFSRSYTECASMAVRGLKRLPLPKLDYPKLINPCMAETLWNCLCHQAKSWPSVAKHLEKLQQMQISHGLPHYSPPAIKIFLGTGFRKLWDDAQRMKIARTRDWIPGMSAECKRIAGEKVAEYVKQYDYNTPTVVPPEPELLEQLLWTSERRGEAYLRSIPTTTWFYSSMKQCIDSENGTYLILDMQKFRTCRKKSAH